MRIHCLLAFVAVCLVSRAETPPPIDADLCVYGATAGGVAAAVQGARLGQRTVLLAEGLHVGGMTSGGLGQTDIGNKGAIGGVAREFYRRLGRHYGQAESWTFEPHVAEDTLFAMLNEAGVALYLDQPLAKIEREGNRLRTLESTSGKIVRARMFIDASYEGDLMALAGVTWRAGREANAEYAEALNGVRAETPKHQFVVHADPYRTPGDASSGLLPLIQSAALAAPGSADQAVQAYNFRLVLTKNPANRRPIAPPSDYDPATFELLARYLLAWERSTNPPPELGLLMHIQMMPNGKTDINNNGGFSTDYIGANHDYPAADRTRRAAIWKAHENYTRGFLHFLATDPRVPDRIRLEMSAWGLTRDEFVATKGWPHQLYVREARRMVSDYVMTEHNCRQSLPLPDSIGLAAYTMDSHNCQRLARNGRVENEGDVQVGGFPPYPIAYRAIVPRERECANLLVPVCVSATHIAYGSIRMEPVFMVLGHSAATAAALASQLEVSVQRVEPARLQTLLREQGQVLEWKGTAGGKR